MRTRRRQHTPRNDRSHGREPARKPKETATKREFLVVKVSDGAKWSARALNKELSSIEFAVDFAEGMREEEGFYEAAPLPGQSARVRLLRRISEDDSASWAAICNHGLRVEWPEAAVAEAESLKPYRFDAGDGRTDWRNLAIVTIDGADARDFDDAVWSENWEDGHHIIVAIADVAHYIRENSELDREAQLRGNSTYFPDRVLPMLPERLSNDLCSLRPQEERPVLGVEMWIDGKGRMKKHTFARGCIFSAARLTYEQVQDYFDGKNTGDFENLPVNKNPETRVETGGNRVAAGGQARKMSGKVVKPCDEKVSDVLKRLFAAYKTLLAARIERGALDLDIPEMKLELTKDGKVASVGMRPRLDAHRLIEELMILANVAAADALSRHGGGGLYRIHPEPTKEKLDNLRAVMSPLGFTVPPANGSPKAWAKLVAQINGTGNGGESHPAAPTLLRAILQSQQQAKYNPDNIGHYGLALPLYSHFTSPIRRYADLVVHRALIAALHLKGEGGLKWDEKRLAQMADQINVSERKSQMAEWEARDRMVARHFVTLVGKPFEAIVTTIVPFGCFIAVDGVAEGLLPKWELWNEGWIFVGSLNCWRKKTAGRPGGPGAKDGKGSIRVGSRVAVVLQEADPLGGRLTFALDTARKPAPPARPDREDGEAKGDFGPGRPVRVSAERNAEMERPVRRSKGRRR